MSKLDDVLPRKMIGGDVFSTVLPNCPQHKDEFGARQTSITVAENEIVKGFYIQMMD